MARLLCFCCGCQTCSHYSKGGASCILSFSLSPAPLVVFFFAEATIKRAPDYSDALLMVGRDGFEPSKSVTADLQSAPFGHSGTYPRYSLCSKRNFLIIARIEHFCQYKNRRKMQKKEKKKTTRQNHVVFSLIDNRLCGRNNFPASAINPARRNT